MVADPFDERAVAGRMEGVDTRPFGSGVGVRVPVVQQALRTGVDGRSGAFPPRGLVALPAFLLLLARGQRLPGGDLGIIRDVRLLRLQARHLGRGARPLFLGDPFPDLFLALVDLVRPEASGAEMGGELPLRYVGPERLRLVEDLLCVPPPAVRRGRPLPQRGRHRAAFRGAVLRIADLRGPVEERADPVPVAHPALVPVDQAPHRPAQIVRQAGPGIERAHPLHQIGVVLRVERDPAGPFREPPRRRQHPERLRHLHVEQRLRRDRGLPGPGFRARPSWRGDGAHERCPSPAWLGLHPAGSRPFPAIPSAGRPPHPVPGGRPSARPPARASRGSPGRAARSSRHSAASPGPPFAVLRSPAGRPVRPDRSPRRSAARGKSRSPARAPQGSPPGPATRTRASCPPEAPRAPPLPLLAQPGPPPASPPDTAHERSPGAAWPPPRSPALRLRPARPGTRGAPGRPRRVGRAAAPHRGVQAMPSRVREDSRTASAIAPCSASISRHSATSSRCRASSASAAASPSPSSATCP